MSKFEFKIREFFLLFMVNYFIIANAIHEYGHLIMLRFLGYEGEIRSVALNRTYFYVTEHMTQLESNLIYLSGGLFQALIYLMLCIGNKDEEHLMVYKMMIINGFIYGLFEAFTAKAWWDIGATITLFIAVIFMTVSLISRSSRASSQSQPSLS